MPGFAPQLGDERGNGGGLVGAEAGLALGAEDRRDRPPGRLRDDVVQVDEPAVEVGRQGAAERRLTGGGHAGQENRDDVG